MEILIAENASFKPNIENFYKLGEFDLLKEML